MIETPEKVQEALNKLEKKYGKGAIMRFGEAVPTEVISTGILTLDKILGIGGFPKGRIVEIYGPESSGKTTIALHVLAEAQKAGGMVAFIDAEHALDPAYATKIGVVMEDVLVSQPDSGEQALEILETLVRTNQVSVIVVDSVAALTPRAEIDGEMGDSLPGMQARLMSQALRKLTHVVSTSNCLVIFINQLREKIGVSWGNPETTTGGKALKFYASIRVDIRRIGAIKDGTDVTGNRTKVKIVKNKLAAPYKEAEFDIMYGEGASVEGDIIDLALQAEILEKRGAWIALEGKTLAQGKESLRTLLKEDKELKDKIKELLKQ